MIIWWGVPGRFLRGMVLPSDAERIRDLELVVAMLLKFAGVLGTLTPAQLEAVRAVGDRGLRAKDA